jgi:hypothetical protein
VLEVHATRLRRLKRTKGRARERERERERCIRIEKERKRKDDDDGDERVFLRIFSVFEFEFSVVGDDSEDENDSDLYYEEAKNDFERFGEFRRWEERRILRRTRQVD